ncbi:MAG: hypothetical protein IJY36_01820 [Coprobacter sp.]|nr:hypothetical protein [Coprobacter sp.]
MNVVISYSEILNFIGRKFNVQPTLATIDEKTLEVSYKPVSFMPSISVRFHLEVIRRNDIVSLSYECGKATSLMIAGIVAKFEDKIPTGIDVDTSNQCVNIYPQRFKQLEKALEYVVLSNITFEENSVNVALIMV